VGNPPPKAGEFFIAIHYQGLDTQLLETNGSVQQEISIGITISQRTRWSPEDRDGDRILLRSLDSLAAFSTAIVPLVHLNFGLVSGVDSSPLLGPHTQACGASSAGEHLWARRKGQKLVDEPREHRPGHAASRVLDDPQLRGRADHH
jgi:hypothetical protein